ncbi:MAG TPA: hypothetical protein VMS31_05350 [Pyrinomonadaceae bacterium]|nr:hypothetical protein [Pyrinomonadaceae bacterium]
MANSDSPGFSRLKLAVAVIASLYFLWCAYDPYQWHLIDGVNLVIHEAGHLVFSPFGEFMMIAGGSLFQVIMPALFVGYFWYNGKYYSAALVLFWVGESILNVSVYAGDSVALQLPLLGGQDSMHDWNYLLSSLNLLQSTSKVAGAIRLLGTVIIAVAALGSVKFSKDDGTDFRSRSGF